MRNGDLRDPIQAVVQALSEEAVERGVALDSVVPAQPVEVRFDRERIVQLMTNLIGNALKFTPGGGGVSVRLEEDADEVTIVVRDTGTGIPADELPRIFDRFYRGTNTGEARLGQWAGAGHRALDRRDAQRQDRHHQRGRRGTEVRITCPGERRHRGRRGRDEGQRNFTHPPPCAQPRAP